MVYLLHLDTETHNSHLYMSAKKIKWFTIHNSTHGEYVWFKKNDSESERTGAEIPCKFNLKCQGFDPGGDLNLPRVLKGLQKMASKNNQVCFEGLGEKDLL